MLTKFISKYLNNSVLNNPGFGVLIYFTFRALSWCFLIDLAPDMVNQLNMANNISEGNGFVLSVFNFGLEIMEYSDYYEHPPMLSLMLSFYNLIFGDLIWSLFVLALTFSLIEATIVNNMMKNMGIIPKSRLGLMLIFGIYIGHLDRGLISDYFALIWAMWFINAVYALFVRMEIHSRNLILLKFSISLILMPFVKYTLIPLVFIPIVLLFFQLITKKKEWLKFRLEIVLIIVNSFLSLFLVFQYIKNSPNSSGQEYFSLDLYNLLKIDYFWLHFGLELDRIYKYIFWNLPSVLTIPFWNIGQLITFGAWCFVLLLYWRMRSFPKLTSVQLIIILFVIAMILQVLFLLFLTITNAPQAPVKYGVDDKVWVYIEEGRYYNYLTLFAFILFTIILFRLNLRIFKYSMLFFVLGGFVLTFNAKFCLRKELPIFVLANEHKDICHIKNSRNLKLIKMEFDKNKRRKWLMEIYGYKYKLHSYKKNYNTPLNPRPGV